MNALSWVDEYIARVRPYVFVRLEDNLLIKRPNVACKLNPSGARILKALLDGAPLAAVLARLTPTQITPTEVGAFLLAVRHYLEGRLNEFCANPAVTTMPHPLEFSTYPVLAEFALTYRCNLRCRFCYAGCNCTRGRTGTAGELTRRAQRRVINTIFEKAHVPSLSFTGGEPLLVPHLAELVRHAKQAGLRVNLITNGTLVDEGMARRLAQAGLDSAQVSLEGVTAATHDALVAMPGAFARAVAAVKHLRAAGIHTHANTTVTRTNLAECIQMPRFVRETLGGDRFSMNLLIPTGSGAEHRELQVRYSEVGELIEALHAESARQDVEFMWYAPMPLCVFNTIARGLGAKGCGACDGLLSVAPNGDVLPCSACDDPVGNLVRDDFQALWQSERTRAYRGKRFAPARCRTCPDLNVCHGACLLYWRALGCEELAQPAPASATLVTSGA
ncbi:MAG: radical SAM protein [bacterium]|nr:radical SAM protein [bacterium]